MSNVNKFRQINSLNYHTDEVILAAGFKSSRASPMSRLLSSDVRPFILSLVSERMANLAAPLSRVWLQPSHAEFLAVKLCWNFLFAAAIVCT